MQSWRKTTLCGFLVLNYLLVWPPDTTAQQPCASLALPSPSQEVNIFTSQQEVYLGDIIAEQISRSLRTTDDPEMIAYLHGIAERLIRRLPDSHLDFRFDLVDLPTPNSFAIAGGRIYVSPKLISLARSEDELAAVIAHEMGHIVTHQTAIQVTRELNDVLGITSVGDRQDILRKYNLLLDNWRRKPRAFRSDPRQSQERQLEADRVALSLVVSAGYSPDAMEAIFERTTGAPEKGGSWLSDLFGRAAPDVRRLKEMVHSLQSLPPNRIDRVAPGSSAEFQKWQRNVHEYSGWDHQQALHGVLSEIHLDPPLQPALWQLRFSPDGKYVLAQDAASIYVLTAQPLSAIMQIEAPGGEHAQFTPDSKSIVFDNGHMRVEKWEIASQKRVAVYELAIPETCRATLLSPDGSAFVCWVKSNQLVLFDVPTGEKIYETKDLYEERAPAYITMPFTYQTVPTGRQHSGILHMAFSPDARYFVAAAGDKSVALEVASHSSITMVGSIRKNLSGGFAFLGPDRILAAPEYREDHALLLKFPSGEKLEEIPLGRGALTASQDGNFVMLRPVKDFAVGVLDTRTREGILADKQPALDVFGNHYVREQKDGEVGYFEMRGHGEKGVLVSCNII